MHKPSRVIVLCEDRRQSRLVYRFLLRLGILRHQIAIQIAPSGRGAAEQWVREKYVGEVSECRRRIKSGAKTALVVLLDADTQEVKKRFDALAQFLVDKQQPKLDEKRERVARLIPKRNVETWILSLNQENVDEVQDYKGTRNESDWSKLIPNAAEVLHRLYTVGQTQNIIASLGRGVDELRRTFAEGS